MKRRWVASLVLFAVLPFGSRGDAAPGLDGPTSDPVAALAALDRRLADIDGLQLSERQELGRVGEQQAARHARVIARGRAFYRLTRAGLLPIGGGFEALVTHAMHVERARRVLAGDIAEEGRLRAHAADLARQIERLSRERAAVAVQRDETDALRVAAQDDQRRQTEFEKAFQTSTGVAAPADVPSSNSNSLTNDTPAGGFATARGRLLFPVVGQAETSEARRAGAEGAGLEVRAPAGSPVRAVFAGRVAFADRYGAYGRIVILDHGDHYYTVSGNLDEVDVKIGQEVAAGDRIGTIGDDGRGSMLYFEVRHGSRTEAPRAWLGL